MTDTTTTASAAAPTAKQLPAWEASVFTVLHGILGSLSLDPSTKTSLTQTLNDGAATIANVADDAPELAAEGTEAAIGAAGSAIVGATGGVGAAAVGLGEEIAEPIAGDLVDEIVSRLETVFISHNKNTIAAVGSLLGSDSAAVATAQAKVVPTV